MPETIALLAFVTLQRLSELFWSQRNEARLREMGAVEVGAGHYPVMVGLHAAWLAAMWTAGWNHPLVGFFTVLYLIVQVGRAWVLWTLGRRWTARVLVVPGETLVKRGPYRFLNHPNYVVVGLEIVLLPLALNLQVLAVLFGAANLVMLFWRIRAENRALATAAPRNPG